ncbi:alpha-mannosidase [Catellatospora sichuanensis]|uniref:alpha-mannosidase n=1 Tax=Catellatospora sichuanensis TaxID=1969805 RepID=UPI0011825E5F|nr:glycoside hydrolase family 38 C-terminal domain-containing protein [Catellatospora sichuanensis]
MHDDRVLVEQRLRRLLAERIRPAIHSATAALTVHVWHAPGEPVPFTEAAAARYRPTAHGDRWGAPWGTSWFRITGTVPADWAGRAVEALVDLGFEADRPGFQCEGLAYALDGRIVKGLHPRSGHLPVARPAHGGEAVGFLVEAAANPLIDLPWGRTALGDRATAGAEPLYRLGRIELAVFERQVWELVQDLEVLAQLMAELSLHDARRFEILRAVERCLDVTDLSDVPGSASAARDQLREVLSRRAHASAHRISAVGHAHIDTAWLWPLRETVRKVARTTANVTALMDEHPDFRYAMSQAQQLAWMKEHQPQLYARIKEHVAAGRFIPVGGMWVESDTNLPGGESLARQLVHGKRFYAQEFGLDTQEVWLPDSFGYSAALPQLMRLAGVRWFLTQKLSWNQTNRFPHHTFDWEGIDGSRVFTHFPPVDTYNSELSAAELAHAARNFAEKGRATHSLVPFGWGDGGGGPTREMIARARRTADLEGSPQVTMRSPAAFFRAAQAEYPHPPVWAGELYLELHRGTYTSQARTKRGNRRSEHLLREAELWASTAAVAGLAEYPYDDLDRLWKTVLLHQFHDILPGSSIAWVHQEAEQTYRRVCEELERIIDGAQRALAGPGSTPVLFNAAPHARDGLPAMGAALADGGTHDPSAPVTAIAGVEGIVLDNGLLRVRVDPTGEISSLIDLRAGREVVPHGLAANLVQLHPDVPHAWDAWEIDAHYRNTTIEVLAEEVRLDTEAADECVVRTVRRFGRSSMVQWIRLAAGQRSLDIDTEVSWRESEQILKLGFGVDVLTDRATAEIQYGHVNRPTHANTSWDAAKFEMCAHRWLHVGEPGYGVALLNDGTYGHEVTRVRDAHGRTATTVRVSLLRAPRFPDPGTDQGSHRFRHVLLPGADIVDAVRGGYHLNLPVRRVMGGRPVAPLVGVDHDGIVVEAVKLADDRTGDVVVRLYEARGSQTAARLSFARPDATARRTDLMENPLGDGDLPQLRDGSGVTRVDLRLRPFQILTVRFTRHA